MSRRPKSAKQYHHLRLVDMESRAVALTAIYECAASTDCVWHVTAQEFHMSERWTAAVVQTIDFGEDSRCLRICRMPCACVILRSLVMRTDG